MNRRVVPAYNGVPLKPVVKPTEEETMQLPGGMSNMLKQIKKVQETIQKKQEELQNLRVEASAGGGVVRVVANGREEIVDLHIDKEVVDPEDVEMLEDLLLSAIKEAQAKAKEASQKEMDEVMKSLGLPHIPGLF